MSTDLTKRNGGSLAPWRHPFLTLRNEMDDLMTRLMGNDRDWGWTVEAGPPLDMSETENTIEVKMDLPGVKVNDVDIQVNGNLLTISGKREEQHEEKGKNYYRCERSQGSFSRTVTLPCAVQKEKVDAQYRDGILSVSLPKTPEAKAHKIKVKT